MEDKKQKPNYYAILTADVRYDKRLTANAKLLYAEITALTNAKGYCWSTNAYFANLYGVSNTSISKWVSQLVKLGYLDIKLIYREGTKEILHRYLSLVTQGIEEKLHTPIEEKLKDNTTNYNTKVNTKESREKTARFVPPTIEDIFNYMTDEKNKEKSFAKKESEKMFNFYESKGWLVGKTKMKNWKAAASNWITRAETDFASKDKPAFKLKTNRPT
jgi:hypothetical protein